MTEAFHCACPAVSPSQDNSLWKGAVIDARLKTRMVRR